MEISIKHKWVVTIHRERKPRMVHQYKDRDKDDEDEKKSHFI